jgi:hypothetical protein
MMIAAEFMKGNPMPRGRTRSVTSTVSPLVPGAKLAAPVELTSAQAAIWDRVIGTLPSGWINGGSEPLAKELCRHIDFADRSAIDIEWARSQLAALVSKAAAAEGAEARKLEVCRRKAQALLLSLMRMHRLQSAAVAHLSTKLRLSKLSQFTRDAESAAIAARNASTAPEPWNDWGGGNGGRGQQ